MQNYLFVYSPQLPYDVLLFPPLLNESSEAQRGLVTCSRTHDKRLRRRFKPDSLAPWPVLLSTILHSFGWMSAIQPPFTPEFTSLLTLLPITHPPVISSVIHPFIHPWFYYPPIFLFFHQPSIFHSPIYPFTYKHIHCVGSLSSVVFCFIWRRSFSILGSKRMLSEAGDPLVNTNSLAPKTYLGLLLTLIGWCSLECCCLLVHFPPSVNQWRFSPFNILQMCKAPGSSRNTLDFLDMIINEYLAGPIPWPKNWKLY